MIINLDDEISDRNDDIDHVFVMNGLQKAADTLNLPQSIIDITYVNREESHNLNSKYRQIEKPATVLSFPQFEFKKPLLFEDDIKASEDSPPIVLGDLVLCISCIKERFPKIELNAAILRMAVHGLLHLTGFTHESDEDFEIMWEYEKEILADLDIQM